MPFASPARRGETDARCASGPVIRMAPRHGRDAPSDL